MDAVLRRRAISAARPKKSGIYMTPTYGNTLMGLACSKPVTAAEGYKIIVLRAAAAGRASKWSISTTPIASSATAKRAA